MAEKKGNGYRYITFDDDTEEEEVFHAGTKRETSTAFGSAACQQKATPSSGLASSGAAGSGQPASAASAASDTGEGRSAQGADEVSPQPTAEERARAKRRQRAEEIAAMEDDLQSTGSLTVPHKVLIAVSVVVLVLIIAYVAWSFLA